MSPNECDGDGIVVVAHTKRAYLEEALVLARSIRRFSPSVPLALVTNFDLTDRLAAVAEFSTVVRRDFGRFPGLEFKLHLDHLSPFSGTTLFVDSDTICYGDIGAVFDAFQGKEFVTLGTSAEECGWFQDMALIRKELAISQFPFFCGDFYLFRRSPLSRSIFEAAREIATRYDELRINRLGRMLNDEPVISLAMARHGVCAQPNSREWILQVPHTSQGRTSLSYVDAHAEALLGGEVFHPKLVHFHAHRSKPIYFREKFLVNTWGNRWASIGLARIVGVVQSFMFRAKRRMKRLGWRS